MYKLIKKRKGNQMQLDTSLTQEEQKMQEQYESEQYQDNDTMTHKLFIDRMTEEEREEYYYDLRQQRYNLWRELS